MTVKLISQAGERAVSCEKESTILTCLAENGVYPLPDTACGGRAACGKCKVRCGGALSAPDAQERRLLGAALDEGYRLACMARVCGDAFVHLPQREIYIEQAAEFPVQYRIDGSSGYGVAVDIGTTTIALYLCDRATGRAVATATTENPQRIYGADVLSRVEQAIRAPEARAAMQTLIFAAIRRMIAAVCREKSLSLPAEVTIVGNTAMLYLLLGLDPSPIVRPELLPDILFAGSDGEGLLCALPLLPAHTPGESTAGAPEGMDVPVRVLPCLSPFIGADAVCGAAMHLWGRKGTILYLDVGTNAEMALLHNGRLTFCAAAAGPAFEGAHIEMGMCAEPGAVCHVDFQRDRLCLDVLGGGRARGLCGSGIISGCAALLRAGLIDRHGAMTAYAALSPKLRPYAEPDGQAIYLSRRDEIRLTVGDIREVQVAKAAVAAGIACLLSDAGISVDALDEIILAGGFGMHIDPASAMEIGMIPRIPADRVKAVGNAACAGAAACLLSGDARRDVAAVTGGSRYLSLSASEEFSALFVQNMDF